MSFSEDMRNIKGVVIVQIEGFFTERFINLCKMRNVKIWNVKNIVKGVVRFKINISDFKKLRPIAKKTKCSVKIKEKKGVYFTLFKYRKRKIVFILITLLIVFSISFSMFIWQINITGNESIPNQKITDALKNSGVYIGKCKIGMDKKQIVNDLRVELSDISWAGIDIEGTSANISIVEKTKLKDEHVQRTIPGDIISNKSGVISKIVPENGTAKYKPGSYVEAGSVVIEGKLYSKFLEPTDVVAKGIVKINVEYILEKEYLFEEIVKENTGKKLFTIGIGINSKENMLNYLNKSKKYDITKASKSINLFGSEISFDLYKCIEYIEKPKQNTYDELVAKYEVESTKYLEEEVLKNTDSGVLVDKQVQIVKNENGIVVQTKFIVNEKIGEYVERGTQ